MSEPNTPKIWYARPPDASAEAPEWMSFSRLREIEACPRRWALGAAAYPEIWSKKGYPRKEHPASLRGRIIHQSLEIILKGLAEAGCSSVRDACFVSVLRALGGYTKIIENAVKIIGSKLRSNPRHVHNAETITNGLRADIPELRGRLQRLASRLRLEARMSPKASTFGSKTVERSALPFGTYSEVELRVESLRWRGFVDAMTISEGGCEIADYKTGTPKPEHGEQLRLYSLLWSRDKQLNPMNRPATSLTLLYPNQDVSVAPPTAAELTLFEQEIINRAESAGRALRQTPVPAFPSPQNCSYCSVRQLCDAYWSHGGQHHISQESKSQAPSLDVQLIDLEVDIVEQQTPSTWTAIVLHCRAFPTNTSVTIRAGIAHPAISNVLESGRRIRIIDALISTERGEENPAEVITLTKFSEAFVVD